MHSLLDRGVGSRAQVLTHAVVRDLGVVARTILTVLSLALL